MKIEITHNFFVPENEDALVGQEVDKDAEGEPDVCQSEPGKQKREGVVLNLDRKLTKVLEGSFTHQGLDMEEKHAYHAVTRLVKPEKVDQSVLTT